MVVHVKQNSEVSSSALNIIKTVIVGDICFKHPYEETLQTLNLFICNNANK